MCENYANLKKKKEKEKQSMNRDIHPFEKLKNKEGWGRKRTRERPL